MSSSWASYGMPIRAVCSTTSASSARISPMSPVAMTPVGAVRAISPASRPILRSE